VEAEKFREFWQSNFDQAYPVGYMLRQVYQKRWFRIHTLPNSKRYAETEPEVETILNRHNHIITQLVGNDSSFLLVTTGFSLDEVIGYPSDELACIGQSSAEFALRVPIHEIHDEDGPHYYDIWLSHLTWKSGLLDPLLRLVADDQTRNIGIVNPHPPALYFPYDGGGDVILSSVSARDRMREQYRDWLSSHPSGL
jgi:hypothetical protein